jgi:DNA modification methylase
MSDVNKKFMTSLLKKGLQITPEALLMVSSEEEANKIMSEIEKMEKSTIITPDIIRSITQSQTVRVRKVNEIHQEQQLESSKSKPEKPKQEEKLDRKKKEVKKSKKANDLDGKTWTRYSISIWDIIKSPDEMKLKHPAMFPKELAERLIRIYTKKGDVVLDPFLGSGSTILAAKTLNRKGVGFEIAEKFVKLTKKRVAQQLLNSKDDIAEPVIYEDDARRILDHLKPNSVDLVVTSPPYWDIHLQKRTADYKDIRPYTESKIDLGNISNYGEFIDALKDIFGKVHTVLRPGKWCVIVIMDIRKKDKLYALHMDISKMMQKVGFKLEDIIIWDRRLEYSNLRPLGYPYVFRVNKVHEYIMIFKKMKELVIND